MKSQSSHTFVMPRLLGLAGQLLRCYAAETAKLKKAAGVLLLSWNMVIH